MNNDPYKQGDVWRGPRVNGTNITGLGCGKMFLRQPGQMDLLVLPGGEITAVPLPGLPRPDYFGPPEITFVSDKEDALESAINARRMKD